MTLQGNQGNLLDGLTLGMGDSILHSVTNFSLTFPVGTSTCVFSEVTRDSGGVEVFRPTLLQRLDEVLENKMSTKVLVLNKGISVRLTPFIDIPTFVPHRHSSRSKRGDPTD